MENLLRIKFGVLEYMITLIKFSIKKIISWTKRKKKKNFEPLKSFPGHKVATTPKPQLSPTPWKPPIVQ